MTDVTYTIPVGSMAVVYANVPGLYNGSGKGVKPVDISCERAIEKECIFDVNDAIVDTNGYITHIETRTGSNIPRKFMRFAIPPGSKYPGAYTGRIWPDVGYIEVNTLDILIIQK